MRSLLLAVIAGCLAGHLAPAPVRAAEPLFLRIRPNGPGRDVPAGAAAPAGVSDEALAERARARREAVWARSDARARIAIASVCTGCMKALPSTPAVPSSRLAAIESASNFEIIAVPGASASSAASVPPATLLATAGEP